MVEQITREEQEEFLERAEDINAKIQGLLNGTISADDIEKEEFEHDEKENLREKAKEIKKREIEEKLRKGRPGKGHQGGYLTFCRTCLREFTIAGIDTCPQCGKATISEQERMEELRSRLEEYKTAQAVKMTRRGKWENWRKTQEMFYKKTSTNYHKWDMYESDSEEEEEKEPIVPKNDPTFQAMEADFDRRAAERKKAKRVAQEFKEQGNKALKAGLYKTAHKHYTDSINSQKDLLVAYTNRALARLKLEMWQEAIDDCTRVLEFCDCFDGGFLKKADLCYKAFIRRAQAHRGRKDFDEALTDLEQASKCLPNEKDPARLSELYTEDKALEERITVIMQNSESLQGKEFIDFILDYLKGVTHKPEGLKPGQRLPKNCQNELKSEEAKKLLKILTKGKNSGELVLYFNAKDGFKVLVDSLYFNLESLQILDATLPENQKLREDFQRQHLYEALIEFLYKRNVKAEGPTLSNSSIYRILVLLENASMNDVVRGKLSEMSKIKDLFLIVIRTVDVNKNKNLVSSLIQFVANLCSGNGKLRKILAGETNLVDFFQSLEEVLASLQTPINQTYIAQEDEEEMTWEKREQERILLKYATLNLIGNICIEQKLRLLVANNTGQILNRVNLMLQFDGTNENDRGVDWLESAGKELAIVINAGLEEPAIKFLADQGIVATLETTWKQAQQLKIEDKQQVPQRCVNALAKVSKTPKGLMGLLLSKSLIISLLAAFGSPIEEMNKNALLSLHRCMSHPEEFRAICLEKHGFKLTTFNSMIKIQQEKVNQLVAEQNHDALINVCHSISQLVICFPEKRADFCSIIKPLIDVVGNKTGAVRKAAAVVLANLAKEEECAKELKKQHGTDVLMSLREQLQ